MTDAIGILTEGTMRAAALMINGTDKFPKLKALGSEGDEAVVKALRAILIDRAPQYREEWGQALVVREPEVFLRAMLNAQCNEAAFNGLIEAEANV